VLAAVTAIIFWANHTHHAQQGTYFFWFEPLARQIAHGHGYTYPSPPDAHALPVTLSLQDALILYQEEGRAYHYPAGVAATYPIWGYALLLSLIELVRLPLATAVLVLQFVLCLASIALLYRLYGIPERLWHIVLFYPWLVLFSIRWPDAIAAFLVCLFLFLMHRAVVRQREGYLVAAALYLGLLYNFRVEYLAYPIAALVALVICRDSLPRFGRFGRLAPAVAILLLSLVCYVPWVAHVSSDRTLRLTPTNSGAVLYISLGQLPDNPWGRTHDDREAYAYVNGFGIDDAMGTAADPLLRDRFFDDVRSHPVAFAKKVAMNFARSVDGRIDGGEFRPEDTASGWGDRLQRGAARGLGAFASSTASAYRWVFRLAEIVLLLVLIVPGVRRTVGPGRLVLWLTLLLWGTKIAVHSLTQYEPRHFAPLWLPLLFVLLAYGPTLWRVMIARRRSTPVAI